MPKNLSAAIDACLYVLIVFAFSAVVFLHDQIIGTAGFILCVVLAAFSIERERVRSTALGHYIKDVTAATNKLKDFAMYNLPPAILVFDADGRVTWVNGMMAEYFGVEFATGTEVQKYWPEFDLQKIWGKTGEKIIEDKGRFFQVKYMPSAAREKADDSAISMGAYITDVTETVELKRDYKEAQTAIAHIEIDNIDEITQGLTELERNGLLFAVNNKLDDWAQAGGIYLRRVANAEYIAVMERAELDKAIEDKFSVLDKVRQIETPNKMQPTLSIGIACETGVNPSEGGERTEKEPLNNLGVQAQKRFELALGRGGDQAAVQMDGKTLYFGGKAQATEKYTRVRSRVTSHALRELMEKADEILVMGHNNEDFDAVGAAIGVARMADFLGKSVHIVLSPTNGGVDKFIEMAKERDLYKGLFITERDLALVDTEKVLVVVVDTHKPERVAAPSLLKKYANSIFVIDHHRRSEPSIEKPVVFFLEPSASSTSEMVTELLMYFDEEMKIQSIDATALFSGIVVDTKNFSVQVGVRTFEAAAYLRRAGADLAAIKRLFSTDYKTNIAIAKARAAAKLHPGGLITAVCPPLSGDLRIIAAQAADALLDIENVRMSVVIFPFDKEGVGISARAKSGLNAQVLMEHFGGGGHQNGAAAQIEKADITEIEQRVIEICEAQIKEMGQK